MGSNQVNDAGKLTAIGKLLAGLASSTTSHPDISPMGAMSLLRLIQEDTGDFDFGATLSWGCSSPGWPQDYHEPELEITIKDESVKPADLAHWVRNGMPLYTSAGSMMVARALLKGETWRPPFEEFRIGIHNPWCLIKVKNEHGYESERFI